MLLQVMNDALAAGTTLAILTETASQPEDDVISALLDQLPSEVAAAVRVYSTSMYSRAQQHAEEEDTYQQGTDPDGSSSSSSSLEASLAAAATKVKQREAQEFVQRMASALQDKQAGVLVKLTPTLQNLGEQP